MPMSAVRQPVITNGPGLPAQANNLQADPKADKAKADALASAIANHHKKGRENKRQRDLLAEMYVMHIDGEADGQWVTIHNGSVLRVRPNLDGGLRTQSNLLRPIVNNYVSYQTAIPYRVIADSKSGQRNKDKAKVDTIYANNVIRSQRLNELFAQGLFLAVPYGFCPLFAAAREDYATEQYESPYLQHLQGIRPVFIDCWLGDPWSMVFNTGATRNSITEVTYERVLPLSVVQEGFKNVPWIADLKGRRDLPQASRFQRIAKKWLRESVHGHPIITGSDQDGEEMVAVVCKECAPGVKPEYPDGRLVIVGLSGVGDTAKQSLGTPMMLYDSAQDQGAGLPGRRFSFVRLYSDQRNDDPYGYPWITPLDPLQTRVNNLETALENAIQRASAPQLAVGPNGGADDDTYGFEPDGIVESSDGKFNPYYIEYPTGWMAATEARVEAVKNEMFRIGGWQASSRGESNAGDPYSKVVALQQADDSQHGAMNRQLVGTLVEYLQLIHCLTKEHTFQNQPIPVISAGDDFEYLDKQYIYAEDMSDEPPAIEVVSGFGSTKEAVAQQLINLLPLKDGLGVPLLTAKQLKKQFPDQSIWPNETDLEDVLKRRAKGINYLIRDLCRQIEPDPDRAPVLPTPPLVQQILMMLDQTEPISVTDNVDINIEALTELCQDMSESRLVRAVAEGRVDLNNQWKAQIFATQQPIQQESGAPPSDDAGGQAMTPSAPEQQQGPPQRVAPVEPIT